MRLKKNGWDDGRLDISGKVHELKIQQQKLTKVKHRGIKYNYEQFISELWENFKQPNIHIIGVSK